MSLKADIGDGAAMTKSEESAFIRGEKAAWRMMFVQCLNELGAEEARNAISEWEAIRVRANHAATGGAGA